MRWEAEIETRLADPTARVLCLDPTGGKVVELHGALSAFAEQAHQTSGPLDLFASHTRAEIVKTFGLAKLRGTSSTEVPIRNGEHRQFDMYNEVDTIGCYVVIMGPPTGMWTSQTAEIAELRVRTTTYSLDIAGNIVAAHPDIERMLGWGAAEMIGRSSLDFVHPDDHEKGIVGWIELLDKGRGARCRMRQRFLTKDGTWRWLEDTSTNYLDDPEKGVISSELIDISDEMAALEEAERRDALLTRLTEALPAGVLHIGVHRLPIFWNQRWMELLGQASPSIEGLLQQLHESDEVAEAIDRAILDGADADIDVTLTNGKNLRYGRLQLRPLEHANGSAEVLFTMEDTTTARKYQQDLHDLAHQDSLTGLLSRLGLRVVVEEMLESTTGTRALLFVDLDAFKPINDNYGHAAGDAVLRAVGRSITSAVRERDEVARIGGDEFIVAVRDAASSHELTEIVARIHAALRDAEVATPQPVTISASIGTAEVLPTDTFDSLLRRADQAMYKIKRAKQAIRSPL